ncbi:hypothetical protein ACSBR2_012719 [Camellia fascicularis]
METSQTMATFMGPPPVPTYVSFYPHNNNIIAIGMDDSTFMIYDACANEVKSKLEGHSKLITSLAFPSLLNLLVSVVVDNQFQQDQKHFLVMHELKLVVFETIKLELDGLGDFGSNLTCNISCNSQLIYMAFLDGTVCIFRVSDLRPRCLINPAAYLLSSSSHVIYPVVVTVNPNESN